MSTNPTLTVVSSPYANLSYLPANNRALVSPAMVSPVLSPAVIPQAVMPQAVVPQAVMPQAIMPQMALSPAVSPVPQVASPFPAIMSPNANPVPSVHSRPFVPSVDLTYSRPLLSMVENMNADPKVHKQMTKYFYYKMLDKWLYKDSLAILSLLQINKGNVSLIKDLDKYNADDVLKDSNDDVEKKIDFLEDNLFTQNMVQNTLHKFVGDTNINWYDMTKYEGPIREILSKTLKSKLKRSIVGLDKPRKGKKSKADKDDDDSDSE